MTTALNPAWVAGITGGKGASVVTGLPYPAAVSSDSTYLVDQYSNPLMLMGDTVWALCANAGRYSSGNVHGDYDTYFSTRAAQGYNAAEVSLLCSGDSNDNFAYTTLQDYDGTWPFTSTNDPTSGANSTFWAKRDYMFTSAASSGITVVANLAGVGPTTQCSSWTTAQWQAYGTFLGARYAAQPNIIWICGDGTFGSYDAGLASWLTYARAAGDTHIISYESNNEQSSRYGFGNGNTGNDPCPFSIHATLDWCYSYNVSYQGILASIANEPSGTDVVQGRIPIVRGDGTYLASGGYLTDGQQCRNNIWWALTSGACGAVTGDNSVITWDAGSPAELSVAWYAANIPHIFSTFQNLPGWWKLRPDSSSTLVTAGRNSPAAAIVPDAFYSGSPVDTYVTAAYAADGSLALIYCAVAMSITINQSVMHSGYTAEWVDPASGAVTSTTAGSSYSSTGLGNNSSGYPDWLLVLKYP